MYEERPRIMAGLIALGIAVLGGGIVGRGCSSSPNKTTQIVGNSAYLNFNYSGQDPVNLLDENNTIAGLVDLKTGEAGATYGFIHPTLRIPVNYQTTPESQRLVEDLTMKLYRRNIPESTLGYIPDWFCEYDKNHDRIMQKEEIQTWEADVLKKGLRRP